MRKQLALGALLALGIGTQALAADGFSYNLAEAGYVSTEVDDLDIDGDGISVNASVEFGPNVFGFAGVNDIDYEGGVDSNQFTLGLGYHWPLSPSLDLVSGLSYERVRVDVAGAGSASDSGFGLNVGLRGSIAGNVELAAGVKYVDLGHDVDDFTVSASGRYYFTEAFAVGPEISHNDDGTALGISFRYDFGRR